MVNGSQNHQLIEGLIQKNTLKKKIKLKPQANLTN